MPLLKHIAVFLAVFGLSGCLNDGFVQESTRSAAKSVVTPIVQEQFPGVNTEPYVDCVIDNATTAEIFDLAGAAITGPDADAVATVTNIATRPETINCILKAGLIPAVL